MCITSQLKKNSTRATKAVRTPPSTVYTATCKLLLAVAGCIFIAMFHWLGNSRSVQMESSSLFAWIGRQWLESGGDFSHAWMMPLLSLWFVWVKRREIADSEKSASRLGLTVVVLSLLLHWVAFRAQQPRVSLVALVGLVWGIPFYLYGWPVARALVFPCAYLLLCFTSYFLYYFTFQMRLLANAISAFLLNGIGISTHRVGTAIYSAAGGGFHFDVADPCSGLRSLVVMMAMAAPYAYVTQSTNVKKWALFMLSLPLAIVANATRIVTIAVVAESFGSDVAMKIYHDYSGYLLFLIATALLISAGALLNKPIRSWSPHVREKGPTT